jgi:signal transduction histidine kinase
MISATARNRLLTALPIVGLLLAFYAISQFNFLLFHSLIEMFTILIAGATFMLAWNVRRISSNGFLTFLGVAALYVVIFDTLHTLAYPGFSVFANAGTNLASQLWIAGQLFQAIAVAGAPLFLTRQLGIKRALGVLGLLSILLLLSIFVWKNFPTTFIEGFGLTPFKNITEYVISSLMLLGLLLTVHFKSQFEPGMFELLAAATAIMIVAEVMFTFYSSINDQTIIFAHLIRALAYFLIYKALIESSLLKPYQIMFQSLNRSQVELQQKTRELEAHVRELDAFGHTVAHELHGPLSTIITTAETIEKFEMPADERKDLLHGIIQTGRRMSRIVDELMLLAQIRGADVPSQKLEMGAILERTLDRMSALVTNQKAHIVHPQQWPVACGYGPWVEEVWANYISNAIKYGGQPPTLAFGADAQPDGFIRFWLQDNGPGVAQDQIATLFDSYSKPARSRLGSHGLGLSIVKRIVEKLGGSVGVSVTEGAGSRFYFCLPAPADPAGQSRRSATHESPAAITSPAFKT